MLESIPREILSDFKTGYSPTLALTSYDRLLFPIPSQIIMRDQKSVLSIVALMWYGQRVDDLATSEINPVSDNIGALEIIQPSAIHGTKSFTI